MDDKKRYNYMEKVLQNVNRNYISLPNYEVKRNSAVVKEVVTKIRTKMEKNALFKTMFSKIFYGGSYYDGLRVAHPEEFDLDLLLTLPKATKPVLTISNIPGYMQLQLTAIDKFLKQSEARKYPGLTELLDEKNYLVTDKILSWIQSVIDKALNDFDQSENGSIIKTSRGTFEAKVHKEGPAFTLNLEGYRNGNVINIDVDLVPCFVFANEKWPPTPFRQNPIRNKPNFFIVPKKPKGRENVEPHLERYWRLSFQEQERELIKDCHFLKPAAKLLKRLRDMEDHQAIASYYIKTIFLWELEEDETLWTNSLSYVFMTMLKRYQAFIEEQRIPYYWNRRNNLIDPSVTFEDIANRLQTIINNIEQNPLNPYVVAEYLVPEDKIETLKMETPIGKRTLKGLRRRLNISNGQ